MRGLSVEQCLELGLKQTVNELLKVPFQDVDLEANLADFGFDSISLLDFARALSDIYSLEITPALFFGYSTLEKLIKYFLTEHSQIIEEVYRKTEETAQVAIAPAKIQKIKSKLQSIRKSRLSFHASSPAMTEPIAIIGMSGRFPQAQLSGRDVEHFSRR